MLVLALFVDEELLLLILIIHFSPKLNIPRLLLLLIIIEVVIQCRRELEAQIGCLIHIGNGATVFL